MISSISSNQAAGLATAPGPQRQNFSELAKSLRSGDVDGARQAYASLVRNAPDGATWPAGSPFADLGKSLLKGDLDGARTAFASMLKDRMGTPPTGPVSPGDPAPSVPSSTGGDSGGLVNVVA